MPKPILVATDGSDRAQRAVEMAARLSVALSTELEIAHVLMHARPSEDWLRMAETEHMIEYYSKAGRDNVSDLLTMTRDDTRAARAVAVLGEDILAQAEARARHLGVKKIKTRTAMGDYADELLDLAEAITPEILVMGHRGLGRVTGIFLGSVAQKVLHKAPCPVLIVP